MRGCPPWNHFTKCSCIVWLCGLGIAWTLRLIGKIHTLLENGGAFQFTLLVKHYGGGKGLYWLFWVSRLNMDLVFEASVFTWVAGSSAGWSCLCGDCHMDLQGTSLQLEGLSCELGTWIVPTNLLWFQDGHFGQKIKVRWPEQQHQWTIEWHRFQNKQRDSCFLI